MIESDRLPYSDAYRSFCEATQAPIQDLAISGGEDYELLFTVNPEQEAEIEALSGREDFPILTRVGQVEAGEENLFVEDEAGGRRVLEKGGFDHFA